MDGRDQLAQMIAMRPNSPSGQGYGTANEQFNVPRPALPEMPPQIPPGWRPPGDPSLLDMLQQFGGGPSPRGAPIPELGAPPIPGAPGGAEMGLPYMPPSSQALPPVRRPLAPQQGAPMPQIEVPWNPMQRPGEQLI
jgi:hypothetical protein